MLTPRLSGAELTQAEAEAKWDEWIAKYDSNKDGKFSYEEFAAACRCDLRLAAPET